MGRGAATAAAAGRHSPSGSAGKERPGPPHGSFAILAPTPIPLLPALAGRGRSRCSAHPPLPTAVLLPGPAANRGGCDTAPLLCPHRGSQLLPPPPSSSHLSLLFLLLLLRLLAAAAAPHPSAPRSAAAAAQDDAISLTAASAAPARLPPPPPATPPGPAPAGPVRAPGAGAAGTCGAAPAGGPARHRALRSGGGREEASLSPGSSKGTGLIPSACPGLNQVGAAAGRRAGSAEWTPGEAGPGCRPGAPSAARSLLGRDKEGSCGSLSPDKAPVRRREPAHPGAVRAIKAGVSPPPPPASLPPLPAGRAPPPRQDPVLPP